MASEPRRAWTCLLACLLAWSVLGVARAADPAIVPADAALRPGRAATVYVASDPGAPGPPLVTWGGDVERVGPIVEGLEAWRIRPALDADVVRLRAGATELAVPVELPPPSGLRLPGSLEGVAGGEPVVFRVTGSPLPPPEALQVALGEGSVLSVSAVEGALEVRIQPDGAPFPRVIPVGVRDARRDERPVWGLLRLVARPVVPVDTEPGATVRLRVGARDYGPYRADASGQVRARVHQWPGEALATAVAVDATGNETWVELPLAAASHPLMAALAEGDIVPGEPMPLVWLRTTRADGRAVDGAPACRSLDRELPVRALDDGVFLLAAPDTVGDLRVECALAGSTHVFRIPFADGVPARIRTHIWPAELRADRPVAEVRAVLEDGQGVELPPRGLSLRAERGVVDAHAEDGALVGSYEGYAAVGSGGDVIVARWDAEGPGSWPRHLEIGWTTEPGGGTLAHGRALDPRMRPVAEVPLEFVVAGVRAQAITGLDGWATARIPEVEVGQVMRVVGAFGEHAVPLVPGTSHGGPGTSDLVAREPVRILPGQTVGIALEVLPPVLQASPGARARIRVTLEDRAGARVDDRPVELDVSSGVVSALQRRPDGTFVAEYDPGRVDRAREIVVTARTDDLRSSTTFRVEPRNLRVAVGPWAGVHTNLGAITAPVVGVEGEIRVRSELLGEAAAVRLGVSTYAFETDAETPLDEDPRIRSRVVPFTAALAFRQDVGAIDVVAGAGAAVGVHAMDLYLGSARVGGGSVLLAGPLVTAGAARELLGGEIVLMLRGTWLIQKRGEFGHDGNVGGLATGLGYRLSF